MRISPKGNIGKKYEHKSLSHKSRLNFFFHHIIMIAQVTINVNPFVLDDELSNAELLFASK